jgi:hypothetical protein
MDSLRKTHIEREKAILADLEFSFPEFTGEKLIWDPVAEGQDPPDFAGIGPRGRIGLELIEWLDGSQMGPAKASESQCDQIHRVLAHNWKQEYRPQHFHSASVAPVGNKRIAPSDEDSLRTQFYAFAAEIDRDWPSNCALYGNVHHYWSAEFRNYPLLEKYFRSIRCIGGEPHGARWINIEMDGGAYDPCVSIETMKQALDRKLGDYCSPEKQKHLGSTHPH